jgi:cyanophycinase
VAGTILFLLGSGKAFEITAEEFVPAAGGSKASIVLLLYSNNDKTPKYVAEYAAPWLKRGVVRYDVVMPDVSGVLDIEAARRKISSATGIFIGGGTTERYRELFATAPLAQLIRDRYELGVPVAGCSAGAMITTDHCPHYNDAEELDGFRPGLGLLRDIMIGVHFSERGVRRFLLAEMKLAGVRQGLGIDEPACAVLVDGKLDHTMGTAVHRIVVSDFGTMAYEETAL